MHSSAPNVDLPGNCRSLDRWRIMSMARYGTVAPAGSSGVTRGTDALKLTAAKQHLIAAMRNNMANCVGRSDATRISG
jgi:hypothetical protein